MQILPAKGSPRRLPTIIGLIAIALCSLCALWSLIEPRLLLVREVTVTHPEVPAEFDGTRIAFVSDIHAGSLLGRKRVVRVIDDVNALQADLIVLGGDAAGGGPHDEAWFYPEAARLEAPLGVYSVLGNHDDGIAGRIARRRLPQAGITLLENESMRLRQGTASMRLAGVADRLTGSPDFRSVAQGTRADGYSIIVSHNPDALVDGLPASHGGFDLALSGHTHGGQVTFFGLWAPISNSDYGQRFVHGWTTVDGVPVLVSKGAGVFALPIRFFAPPEIHLIELHQGPASITER